MTDRNGLTKTTRGGSVWLKPSGKKDNGFGAGFRQEQSTLLLYRLYFCERNNHTISGGI